MPKLKAKLKYSPGHNKSKVKILSYLASKNPNSSIAAISIYLATGVPYSSLVSLLTRYTSWRYVKRQLLYCEGEWRTRYYYKITPRGKHALHLISRDMDTIRIKREMEAFAKFAMEAVQSKWGGRWWDERDYAIVQVIKDAFLMKKAAIPAKRY